MQDDGVRTDPRAVTHSNGPEYLRACPDDHVSSDLRMSVGLIP